MSSPRTSSTHTAIAPPEARYFLSLRLRNVRCFGEPAQVLDLSDGQDANRPAQWTILLGENGTGKTTALQSFALFELTKSGSDHRRVTWATQTFGWGLDDPYPQTLARSPSLDFAIEVNVAQGEKLQSTKGYQRSRSIVESRAGNTESIITVTGASAQLRSVLVQSTGQVPLCFGYGAGRRLGSRPLADATDDVSFGLFNDESLLRNAEDWLIRLDYSTHRAGNQAEQKRRLDQAKSILIGVLPDVEDLRFSSTSGPNPRPTVEFHTPYGWVPLRQLGYGYQAMLSWIVDLVSRMVERYPDSPNPLAEPAVVLVDEIDLHLHPRWQRDLIGFLTERFPNTQFIATAHSPLIVQAAASVGANLALLRREGDHVVIDNDVDQVRGWSVDQILTSDLFGLATARPPDLEASLERRKALLTKPRLSAADKKELHRLESEIGPLPTGETFDQAKHMLELIEETQRLVKKHLGPDQ